MCPYCGFVRGEADEEQMLEFQRRKLRDHLYHLKMTSYVIISMFLVAFGWYWWDTGGFLYRSSYGPLALVAVASLAYFVIRVLLFRTRKQLRRL